MSWTTEPLSALASRTTNGHALAALRAPIASAYSYRPQRVGATGNVRGATANLKLTFRLDRSGGSAAATTSASVRRSMSCIHEQPTEGVRPNARENGQIRPSTKRSGYRGAGSGRHLASVLQEGRENANIDAGFGFIWRISV